MPGPTKRIATRGWRSCWSTRSRSARAIRRHATTAAAIKSHAVKASQRRDEAALLQIDAAVLEYFRPAVEFAAVVLLELRRRIADRADAEWIELGADLRVGGDLGDGALDLVDDRGRRAGRR